MKVIFSNSGRKKQCFKKNSCLLSSVLFVNTTPLKPCRTIQLSQFRPNEIPITDQLSLCRISFNTGERSFGSRKGGKRCSEQKKI